MLVEDDEDDFIMTQALLSEIDDPECALTWAQTFEEGLQRLLEGSFDVCLLDYALGERTGMELLAQSATAGVEVPIIFLTAQDQRRLDVEATRLGAADYLVKSRSAPTCSSGRSATRSSGRGRSRPCAS
nr:response regulator [Nannocystis pusilla]